MANKERAHSKTFSELIVPRFRKISPSWLDVGRDLSSSALWKQGSMDMLMSFLPVMDGFRVRFSTALTEESRALVLVKRVSSEHFTRMDSVDASFSVCASSLCSAFPTLSTVKIVRSPLSREVSRNLPRLAFVNPRTPERAESDYFDPVGVKFCPRDGPYLRRSDGLPPVFPVPHPSSRPSLPPSTLFGTQ
ncbi:hypothetical protein CEXT_645941 [Caerostris extrusa]|uniref:Uncharacterized protein n=1 Tax=Caerostris extrusa TaxID=172846 RepID=A0AAV4MFZ8_CAEEX|nr:hypothetical protein CEXT_645941 [Caerostris extrusa]